MRKNINAGQPFGVLYGNDSEGHWILGTGYVDLSGGTSIVISNDPNGGVQRAQTYDEFLKYYTNLSGSTQIWSWTFTARVLSQFLKQ